MIIVKTHGTFNNSEHYLKNAKRKNYMHLLTRFAVDGVSKLEKATPVNTGTTAKSWNYNIIKTKNGYTIEWTNSNVNDGCAVALLIQYGHGTKNGAFVQGIDYINPALKPVFKEMADALWKEVKH